MKKISKIAVVVMALAMMVTLAACGSNNSSKSSSKTSESSASEKTTSAAEKTTSAAEETTEAEKEANVLVGSWDSVDTPGTIYTFNEDNTGNLLVLNSEVPFTYEIKDNTVTLSSEIDKGNPDTFVFAVEGDKLTLTSNDGTSLTFTKKTAEADANAAEAATGDNSDSEIEE